jgi:hypothetical protein
MLRTRLAEPAVPLQILRQSVGRTVAREPQQLIVERIDFSSSLIITEAPLQIPEQRFSLVLTETGAVLENYPKDSWPKIVVHLEAASPLAKPEVKQFPLRPSTNTALGEVLYTGVLYAVTQTGGCIIPLPGFGDLQLDILPLTQSEREQLLFRANLFRKLRYLEEYFTVEFILPDLIAPKEVETIDVIFRGITEGEFPVWGTEITFPQVVLPADADLSGPPFTSPGRFAQSVGESVTIFGRRLEIGPVIVLLEKALLTNTDAPQYIRSRSGQPVDLQLQVLDQRITHRFEKFAEQPRDQLQARLEAFKAELRRQEPEELVALLDQSLQGPIRYPFLDALNEFAADHSELLGKLAE